jgi:hypothetical protein
VQAGEDEFGEIPGQDAFLDVLTNMVGIIILLVVVMGLRTSRAALAPVQADASAAETQPITPESLETARRQAHEAQRNVGDLMNQVVELRQATLLRERERAYLTTYVAAGQQEIDERRAELSVEEQRDFDLRQKLVTAQLLLDDLTQERVGLMSKAAEVEVEVIENKPTPIGRKVTGLTLYLQLRGGHVAIIPLDAFRDELTADFQANIWRLREEDAFERSIGPLDGFRLRYYVERRVATVRVDERQELDRQGTVTQLVRFEVIPVDTPSGEPVDEAMLPNSELSQRLQRFPAGNGVIAIMVFPDSLAELHRLKKWLYAAGYSIAEAPIPEGPWVSFSPHGGYELFAQ